MSPPTSLLILGCGNMGGAMLAGWLAGDAPLTITVVDPVVPQVPAGVRLLRTVPAEHFEVVLLAVKPQTLDQVAPPLASSLTRTTVLLSILAGAELASLATRFPAAGTIVRVMPNLSAAIGKSPLGLYAGAISPAMRSRIDAWLAPLGTPEWLASEAQLDAVTALVGSGPAFVYRFIAAMSAGGAALGLDPAQADRLARAAVEGAALLAAASPAALGELAQRVTSPGGTTAAGLAVIDAEAALSQLIAETLRAARDRGAALAAAAARG